MRGRVFQIEKGLLFVCCTALFLAQAFADGNMEGGTIPTLLAAVIVSGLLSLVDVPMVQVALSAGFALGCCFVPALTFFLPLIAYDMPGESIRRIHTIRLANLVGVIPLILLFSQYSPVIAVGICVLFPIAILLRIRQNEFHTLEAVHRQLRDTNREAQERLRLRNRELMDRQDTDLRAATLTERNRIAREIHDSVGHLLSSSLLQIGALLVGARGSESENGLQTLKTTLAEAMNSIRESVHDLRDESVDLQEQLRVLAGNFTFCPLRLDYGWTSDAGMKVKNAVIAVCREALANIMKHSNATSAAVMLREHPAFRQIVISDNGTVSGYHTDEGMGLSGMEERVRALGGQFRISIESGFEIFISIPKEEFHARTGGG